MATGKNGFFDLWLPRNRRITVEVKQGDLLSRGVVETFAGSKSCITTFRLHGEAEEKP